MGRQYITLEALLLLAGISHKLRGEKDETVERTKIF